MDGLKQNLSPTVRVEECTEFTDIRLEELCQATADAIRDGIGFNWLQSPSTDVLEKYWQGVLLVPERNLFIGYLDHTVAGAIQLIRPGPTKQTTSFCASIQAHFVAPWARGHGLAKDLLKAAERLAILSGFQILRLDVRATQQRAINLYESQGYQRWGTLEKYEHVGGLMIPGHFYWKDLNMPNFESHIM